MARWRASRIATRDLARPVCSLSSASERTARAAACFASLHRYNMPAHIRAAQQVSRTIPPSATRARASNPPRAPQRRGPDPANPKNIPQGRDYTASPARGDDFDRRSKADARDPDPSHSRLQAIQAAKGHVHLKGSSMVSLEAPRSLPRPRGNQRVPLHLLAVGDQTLRCQFLRRDRTRRLTDHPLPLPSQDKITSVVIPMGFTVAAFGLLYKGLDDLSWGKNRKEGF